MANSNTPKPRNIYSPSVKVVSPKGHTPAQQQFKDDCDVNRIMAKFHKTGLIDHTAKYQPEYGFASPLSYHDSLNIISRADSMFADLPSYIRDHFKNSAADFLEFVQDPGNAEAAKELGISLSPEAALVASEQQEAATPSEDSASSEQEVQTAEPIVPSQAT